MKRLLIAMALAYSGIAGASVYGPVFVNEVASVYDGDTFRAQINAWPAVIGANMPIRILGIDTPELRSRCADPEAKARERLRGLAARSFTLEKLSAADTITLHNIVRGSFFRLVAEVRIDGESLGDMLLEAKLAYPYGTGDWCSAEEPQ